RMASEYLVASKRHNNWDFNAGLGWGRMGSAQTLGNPFGLLGNHFKKNRPADGQAPNGPADWFTGKDMGLFAGVSYDTPWVEGLTLSAEWGADRYIAERAAFDFNAPAPWALGVHYAPKPWVSFSTALVGGEKIMASLTLQNALARWPGKLFKKDQQTHEPLHPHRTPVSAPADMESAAKRGDINLYNTSTTATRAQTTLDIPPFYSTPRTVGLALPYISNHAGETVEGLEIRPVYMGLTGPLIRMNRRNVTNALGHHNGSPQEIWHSTEFEPASTPENALLTGNRSYNTHHDLRLALDQQLSLSEDDHGVLFRTAALIEQTTSISDGRHGALLGGMGLRINLAHNLDHLDQYRPPAALPIRSNVADFANTRLGLDRAYFGYTRTIKRDLHMAIAAGYLEEMYAGLGNDILYRPFGSTWAIGAEGWLALKRDPSTSMNMGLNGDRVFTGHLKAYYEFPNTSTTLEGRIGRYLNEDIGATIAVNQSFDHGLQLRGHLTATNQQDQDIFGDNSNLYAGLSMTLPLGNVPLLPQNSIMRVQAAPLGRDNGQALDSPVDLYSMTEPLSYRHIAQNWNDILD
ncbi:MAG TPA: YjbH domain-containing protein, partial [Micavibrio sp.]